MFENNSLSDWCLRMRVERNKVAFENEAPSAHRMKSFFLFTLWS